MKLKLSKQLFWDTNLRDIDERKHADFIIGRVLQMGDLSDFRRIRQRYRLDQIKRTVKKFSFLDVRSAFLWANIFGLPEVKRHICTPASSVQKPFRHFEA